MSLSAYRRHTQNCTGKHPEGSSTGQHEERKRGWKKCDCTIHASGTLAGKFKRKSSGQQDWPEARAVIEAWEARGSWEGHTPVIIDQPAPGGATMDEAIAAFLQDHEEHSASGTVKKYKILMAKLTAYSEHRGYRVLEQWTPQDIRDFRSTWPVSPQTASRDMSVIKSFFNLAVANEWLSRNPASLVKNPKGKSAADSRHEQKLPFSDDELRKMYEVAEKQYGKMEIKWSKESHSKPAQGIVNSWRYSWTGKDLADFISVSVYTGLRISDVATFHIDRLTERGEVKLRTTKTGSHVCVWVPEWVQQMIRRRSLEVGPLIFGQHETADMCVITDIWRRKLKRLWSLCGPWDAKPTPHRFRHTFARILLELPEVSIRDVAELMGNTEAMVRKHYAAWIPGRQERLTSVLKAAFAETPKPANVLEMPKSGTS
jgi:integrase